MKHADRRAARGHESKVVQAGRDILPDDDLRLQGKEFGGENLRLNIGPRKRDRLRSVKIPPVNLKLHRFAAAAT